jgi:hypothetical protein
MIHILTGLGVEFAVESIKLFKPSAVVQIQIENERRCFPFKLSRDEVMSYEGTLRNRRRGRTQGRGQNQSHAPDPEGLSCEYELIEMSAVDVCKEDRSVNSG